jgi:hypothetical protein
VVSVGGLAAADGFGVPRVNDKFEPSNWSSGSLLVKAVPVLLDDANHSIFDLAWAFLSYVESCVQLRLILIVPWLNIITRG